MKNHKKQRTLLWYTNPHCENCGVVTVLPESIDGLNAKGIKPPDNMATIQHKYCRGHPLRLTRAPHNERRRLLWCYKCNQYYNQMYENKY